MIKFKLFLHKNKYLREAEQNSKVNNKFCIKYYSIHIFYTEKRKETYFKNKREYLHEQNIFSYYVIVK